MGSRNFPEAAQWIREHQANKRNVSPQEAKILRGREYNAAKKSESERASSGGKAKAKTGEKSTGSASGQNVHKQEDIASSEKTSSVLAKKHGVNEKTIRRDAVRAELHDAVEESPRGPHHPATIQFPPRTNSDWRLMAVVRALVSFSLPTLPNTLTR